MKMNLKATIFATLMAVCSVFGQTPWQILAWNTNSLAGNPAVTAAVHSTMSSVIATSEVAAAGIVTGGQSNDLNSLKIQMPSVAAEADGWAATSNTTMQGAAAGATAIQPGNLTSILTTGSIYQAFRLTQTDTQAWIVLMSGTGVLYSIGTTNVVTVDDSRVIVVASDVQAVEDPAPGDIFVWDGLNHDYLFASAGWTIRTNGALGWRVRDDSGHYADNYNPNPTGYWSNASQSWNITIAAILTTNLVPCTNSYPIARIADLAPYATIEGLNVVQSNQRL